MTQRIYHSAIVGTGSLTDPFRPAISDVIAGFSTASAPGGSFWVLADTDAPQHAATATIAGVNYLDFAEAPLTAALSSIPSAKLAAARTLLDSLLVPTDDLTGANTVRDVLRRLKHRGSLANVLGSDDFADSLDTLVSAIPPATRQRINIKLQARGLDTGGIGAQTTIRQALHLLVAQFRGG